MVVVEVGEADHVVGVAAGSAQVLPELGGQVDALVRRVGGVPHVGIVHQHLAAVAQVDAGGVSVPERKHGDLRGRHHISSSGSRPLASQGEVTGAYPPVRVGRSHPDIAERLTGDFFLAGLG